MNEHGKKAAAAIATEFVEFYKKIEPLIGPGPSRYLSIVETKLEEASFFAKKAIANKPENSESVSHRLEWQPELRQTMDLKLKENRIEYRREEEEENKYIMVKNIDL